MRVAITGATGFVGAFVLRALIEQPQHQIAVLGRHRESAWRIQDCIDQVDWIDANLDQPESYSKNLHAFKPEAVLHLAWGGVGSADRNLPIQFQSLQGTLALLEESIASGCKHWIGLGSQAEYGPCRDKVSEAQTTQPTTLYGEAKLAACRLAALRCQQANIRFAWLRLFSSFGPTDNPQWMIPYLIRQLHQRERPALTLGEQLWDYIYVADVAAAVIAVLNTSSACGVFNLGSGKTIQLKKFVEKIRNRIDPELPLGFGDVAYRDDQVMHLEADISRLTGMTSWKPKADMDDAISSTVDWYTRERTKQ
jgi:UDP-glucose 4-epimerase